MQEVSVNFKKNRLIVGDGNFSFTRSLVKKREEKGKSSSMIITSEYQTEEQLIKRFRDQFKDNKAYLQGKGVTFLFNLDVTQLSQDVRIQDYHFKRIHFNFPHTGDAYTYKLVSHAFEQFNIVQSLGDKVHMMLVDKKDKRDWWQGHVYGIVEATARASYIYHKKRRVEGRYEGYKHTQTRRSMPSRNARYGKEYIFEKTDKSYEETRDYNQALIKVKKTYYQGKPAEWTYFDCSTSEGTETYESGSFSYSSYKNLSPLSPEKINHTQPPRAYSSAHNYSFLNNLTEKKEPLMQQKESQQKKKEALPLNLTLSNGKNTSGKSTESLVEQSSHNQLSVPNTPPESPRHVDYEKYKNKYKKLKASHQCGDIKITESNVHQLIENSFKYLAGSDGTMEQGKRKFDEICEKEKEKVTQKIRKIRRLDETIASSEIDFESVERTGAALQQIGTLAKQGFFRLACAKADEYLNLEEHPFMSKEESSSETTYMV